jgi:hypothetical protein
LPSGVIGARLAAYSCGGNHGVGPSFFEGGGLTVFPFDPRREPSTIIIPALNSSCQYQEILARHRLSVTHWPLEHLMDQPISRLNADADDPSQTMARSRGL